MQFLYWLESIRNPVLDSFFSVITHLGSETLFMALAIIMFWCTSKYYGYYLMTVGFFGTIMNQFLKLFCRIPRPWVRDPEFTIVESARADAGGYSFPSGHTQSVTASLGCPARIVKSRVLKVVLWVLVGLTALSRMYLGVHTPADVGFSLVVGIVMVYAFYPLFERGKNHPGFLTVLLSVLVAVAALYLAYVELAVWPADIDEHNLISGIKNAYKLMGCSAAMLLSSIVERKYIRFEVKAPLLVQILKVALGLVLVLAIKSGLKPVFNAVCAGHPIADALRYFLIVAFAVCVWPMSFPKICRLFSSKN